MKGGGENIEYSTWIHGEPETTNLFAVELPFCAAAPVDGISCRARAASPKSSVRSERSESAYIFGGRTRAGGRSDREICPPLPLVVPLASRPPPTSVSRFSSPFVVVSRAFSVALALGVKPVTCLISIIFECFQYIFQACFRCAASARILFYRFRLFSIGPGYA